uniref:Uncharacterized protein LOC114324543 n=1 Tax=Diabrotica virgifera virgifera TaxID=50390 RepID=A0A6P7F018_DIAVI
MSRRIDKIFNALNNANESAIMQENVDNNPTSTVIIFQQLSNIIDNVDATIIQDAQIIFVDNNGRIDDDLIGPISQTLVNPTFTIINDTNEHPSELLDSYAETNNEAVEIGHGQNDIFHDNNAEIPNENMETIEDINQILAGSPAENMEISDGDENNDPDFVANSEESNSSESSESISDLQHGEINENDPRDESPRRKRSTNLK